MPRALKTVPLILLLLSACAGKRYGPTRIVDAGAFQNGQVKTMAFLGGDTMSPDVENMVVDALSDRYTQVTSLGSVYRRQAVLVRLGAVHLPAPDPKRYRREGATFGDADPAFAAEIKKKLGVDAFYVVWIVDWTDGPVRSSGPDPAARGKQESLDVHREIVAEIFQAGTGKELWHTHWEHNMFAAPVRAGTAAEVKKQLEEALKEAVEAVWVAFWIG